MLWKNVTNCTVAIGQLQVKHYKTCQDRGLLLKHILVGCEGNRYVLIFIYFFGMIWTFFGISIAADVFMSAIEHITSKQNKKGEKIWNPAVANITLMALGSSAPEILLNIIETIGHGFECGSLGPSSLVGSACFNMCMITATCIFAIPKGETRRIEDVMVFSVVTAFSFFAYVWLIIMLSVISPNEVELWEASVTLLLFGVLVLAAYVTNKGYLKCFSRSKSLVVPEGSIFSEASMFSLKDPRESSPKEGSRQLAIYDDPDDRPRRHSILARPNTGPNSWSRLRREELYRELAIRNPHMSANEIARLAAAEINKHQHRDRAFYRLQLTKWLSNRSIPHPHEDREAYAMRPGAKAPSDDNDEDISTVEFSAEQFAALDTDKAVIVRILRTGALEERAAVHCETIDGSARTDDDFTAYNRLVRFEPEQDEVKLKIPLTHNRALVGEAADSIFYVKLLPPMRNYDNVAIGKTHIAEVVIVTGERTREVQFERTSVIVEETCGYASVPVVRFGGFGEDVRIKWVTKEGSAKDGSDYLGGSGELTFHAGEVRKLIHIPIVDDLEPEKHETFQVKLKTFLQGYHFRRGKHTKATITIVGDESVSTWIDKTDKLTETYRHQMNTVGAHSWTEQFQRFLNVNEGEIHAATVSDYAHHIFSFGWKLLFAFMPPPTLLGGWLTFWVVLGVIGLLTALVADFASVFGCLVGLQDAVTAVTFIAMGTSLPDLFASRMAAMKEDTADEALCNVMASNAVLVYLGLGIPWFIAALYWKCHTAGHFCVSVGELRFIVLIFLLCGVFWLLIILIRRNFKCSGYAELGGPFCMKLGTAGCLTILWFMFMILVSLKVNAKTRLLYINCTARQVTETLFHQRLRDRRKEEIHYL